MAHIDRVFCVGLDTEGGESVVVGRRAGWLLSRSDTERDDALFEVCDVRW